MSRRRNPVLAFSLVILGLSAAQVGLAASRVGDADEQEAAADESSLPAKDSPPTEAATESNVDDAALRERIAKLVADLGAREFQRREEAERALLEIGEPAGDAVRAATKSDNLEVRRRARKLLRQIAVLSRPDERELHVVGGYEGAYPAGVRHGGGLHPEGNALVVVDRPDRAVTLVLGSYEPIKWQIRLTDGTYLERVILCGYHPQSVASVPDYTEVTNASTDRRLGLPYFGYKEGSRKYGTLETRLRQSTGQTVSSFQGRYNLNVVVQVDRVTATKDDDSDD